MYLQLWKPENFTYNPENLKLHLQPLKPWKFLPTTLKPENFTYNPKNLEIVTSKLKTTNTYLHYILRTRKCIADTQFTQF